MSWPPQNRSAIADEPLDSPREIALRAAPAEVRPALRALWEIDLAFANVVSTTLTPNLGEIRLAWWRERLQDLDKGVSPPAEPRLQAVAAALIPLGVTGEELASLEDCWLPLLNPFPWRDVEADAVAKRGALLFGIGAQLLGHEAAEGRSLGEVWSLAEAAVRISDEASRTFFFQKARLAIASVPDKPVPTGLKSLEMLAARRMYDLLHGDRSKWHRVLWAVRFGLSSRFPRS